MLKKGSNTVGVLIHSDLPLKRLNSIYSSLKILSKEFKVEVICYEKTIFDYVFYDEEMNIIRYKDWIHLIKTLTKRIRNYDFLLIFHSEHYPATQFIISSIISEIFSVPYGYFTLEIFGKDIIEIIRKRGNYRDYIKLKILKELEIFFSQMAKFVVVQDTSRKNYIKNLHKLKDEKILCVPNSFIGIRKEKENVLREKFKIPKEKKIILYVGTVDNWTINESVIFSALNWKDFVLVIHTWEKRKHLEMIEKLINEKGAKNKIFISINLLEEEDLKKLVSSADIGLAWYSPPTLDNMRYIKFASGKLNTFLHCGIPVIAPKYIEDFKFIEEEKIGFLAYENEIEKYANKIMGEYESYRNRVLDFYEKNLEFSKNFKIVVEKIKENLK